MTNTDLIPLDAVQADIRPGTAHLAFPIYEALPPYCVPWPVRDGRHEPHLQDGDFALVDTGDRQIAWGELYLVAQMNGPILWAVCKPRGIWADHGANPDRPTAMLRPLAGRYRTNEEAIQAMREGRAYMSDGPIYLEALQEQIIGQVIGLYEQPKPRSR